MNEVEWWCSSARDPHGNEQEGLKGKRRGLFFFLLNIWSKINKKYIYIYTERPMAKNIWKLIGIIGSVSGGKRTRIPLNKDFTLLILIVLFMFITPLSFFFFYSFNNNLMRQCSSNSNSVKGIYLILIFVLSCGTNEANSTKNDLIIYSSPVSWQSLVNFFPKANKER